MRFWTGLMLFVVALACFSQIDPKVRGWEGRQLRGAWWKLAELFGREQPAERSATETTTVDAPPGSEEPAVLACPDGPAACPAEDNAAVNEDADEEESAWVGPGYYSVEGIAPGPAIVYALERETLDAAGGTVLGGPYQSEAGAEACARRVLRERDED